MGKAPKWAPLEKSSTTIKIAMGTSDDGSLVMKSRAKSSHGNQGGTNLAGTDQSPLGNIFGVQAIRALKNKVVYVHLGFIPFPWKLA